MDEPDPAMLPVMHLQEVVALWQVRAIRLLEYADPADYDKLWLRLRHYAEERADLAAERGRPMAGRQWWLLANSMGYTRDVDMVPLTRVLMTAELHVRRALKDGRVVDLREYAQTKATEAEVEMLAQQWTLLAEAADAPEMYEPLNEAVLAKREQRLSRTRKPKKET